MRDNWSRFTGRAVAVFGVNPGSANSHRNFKSNHGFPFPLLVDKGQKVAKQYGAGGLLVKRTVYGIGKDGKIAFAERGMPDPEKILVALTKS